MYYRILLFLVSAIMLQNPLQAGLADTFGRIFGRTEKEQPKEIRVLVGKNLPGAMVEVTGAYNIYDPATHNRVGTRFISKSMFMQPMPHGIRWGEEFPGTYQVQIVPDHETTSILVDGKQYRGTMTIYSVEGRLQMVNTINVEDYLASTLATQVGRDLSNEVLSAVAITARTNAYFLVDSTNHPFYDVEAEDVGYHGHAVYARSDKLQRAVNDTAGIVMQHPESTAGTGQFAAKWTENSAGHTVSYQAMYKRDAGANVPGVAAPFAAHARRYAEWETSLSLSELAQMGNVIGLNNLRLFTDRESGKVFRVRLEGAGGTQDLSFHDFQQVLGPDRVRSAEFTASVVGDQVIFQGVGEGDGVGLCLYEAEHMVANGDKADTVLEHFFPGAQIKLVRPETRKRSSVAEERRKRRDREI